MTRRIVVAPDSFKGTATSSSAAAAITTGWRRIRPADKMITVPLADGGEGTLDAVAASQRVAGRYTREVSGPGSTSVTASWLLLADETAVVELAQSSGLPLLEQPNPGGSDTYGLGQVIGAALDAGARRIVVGLGGSASTDGGTGCLTALGARFLDHTGQPLPLGGRALVDLAQVDLTTLRRPPPGGVVCLVDVTSPLTGPTGAAAVFGPQKGATPADIDVLNRGLVRLSAHLGEGADEAGAGAAGGTAYGLQSVWGAELVPGAATIAHAAGLPEALKDADLLITGEGQFDTTSRAGKVVGHLADLAHTAGVPMAVVAGRITGQPPPAAITLSLTDLAGSSAAAMSEPRRWLLMAGEHLARQFQPSTP